METAGSLGDLGTLLPIAIAMILVNGLDPLGVFFSIGAYYVLTGLYFGVTVPVQPMKVIGAYAIATAMSADQILASALLMGGCLLVLGVSGAIDLIGRMTPKAVVRGVQLSTGALLIAGGVKFVVGISRFQDLQGAVEPWLRIQSLGPVPVSLIIGCIAGFVTLLLLDNRKLPAALVVVAGGVATGLTLGTGLDFKGGEMGFHLPGILPLGLPKGPDFTFALFALVLPQLPMTLGNAVLAYTDLSRTYFSGRSAKVTNRRACLSMAAANLFSFSLGGMPLCHGAGGLAAHYRFGARTAGANLIIGLAFAALAIGFGDNIVRVLSLLPLGILGVLLIFAGAQLALTVMDMETRKEYFTAMLILGITLASNLGVAFLVGLIVANFLKWKRLSV